MGIPDNFTCLLRNMQVKIQQLELDREQQTSSKLGKEYAKTEYSHPAYLITSFNWVLTIGLGFPGGSAGQESAFNAEDLGSIPGLGRSPEGNGYPFQYSGLENSMDYVLHRIAELDKTERLSLSL